MAIRSWQMEWFNNISFNLRPCKKLIHENSQGPKVHCSVMALEPKIEIMMWMWVFRWKCNYVTLYLSSQPHPAPSRDFPELYREKLKLEVQTWNVFADQNAHTLQEIVDVSPCSEWFLAQHIRESHRMSTSCFHSEIKAVRWQFLWNNLSSFTSSLTWACSPMN